MSPALGAWRDCFPEAGGETESLVTSDAASDRRLFYILPTWLLDLARVCLRVCVSQLPPVCWLNPVSFLVFMKPPLASAIYVLDIPSQITAAPAWCHREVRRTTGTSAEKKGKKTKDVLRLIQTVTCIRKPLWWQILCGRYCHSSPPERLRLLSLSSRPFAASALSSGSRAGSFYWRQRGRQL